MGNRSCGAVSARATATNVIAPPYAGDNSYWACAPVNPTCEAHAVPNLQTGGVDVSAEIFGYRPACDLEGGGDPESDCGDALGAYAVSVLRSSDYTLDHPVQAIKFTLTMDLDEAVAEAPVGRAFGNFKLSWLNTGCPAKCNGESQLVLASSDSRYGPKQRSGRITVTGEMRHGDGDLVPAGAVRVFPEFYNFVDPDLSRTINVPAPTPEDPTRIQPSWLAWAKASVLVNRMRISALLVE